MFAPALLAAALATLSPSPLAGEGDSPTASGVRGVTAPAPASQVDALTASPDNFRLVLENDRVRVLEYTLLPGKRDHRHTHPRRVAHVIAGGTLRVHFPDGRHLDFEEKAGDTSWGDPAPLHDTENIGTTPIKILLVEVKDGPAS